MADTGDPKAAAACIDENTALSFAQGELDASALDRIDAHVEGCDDCRQLLDEAARALRGQPTTIRGGQRPAFPVARFQPGAELAGRYRLTRFIARGGMGEVYEAEDRVLGLSVALKTLATALSDDPSAARRLKREVHLARRITHPNVCRIFDLGVHRPSAGADVYFLTMELIPGQSLGNRLRQQGPLSPEKALPIVEAMAEALASAHEAGIVHRDFKSDNVMLAEPAQGGATPRVVVMDFGLAQLSAEPALVHPLSSNLNSSPEGRSVAGTLAYMSPEQLRGQVCLPGSDIYALGLVMFEMVTGRLPFAGQSPLDIASKRLVEEPPSPSLFAPDLPAIWEAVILRCLARQPSQRFGRARDVPAALRAAVRTVNVRRGTGAGDWKWWGAAALTLAVPALGLLAWHLGTEPPGPALARPAMPRATVAEPPAGAPAPLAVVRPAEVADVLPASPAIPIPRARPRDEPRATRGPAVAPAVAASVVDEARVVADPEAEVAEPDTTSVTRDAAAPATTGTPNRWLDDPEEGFIVR